MKKKIFILTTLLCLCLTVACKDDVEIAPVCNCLYTPFISGYSIYFQGNPYNDNETYFIKGIALESVGEYGRKIKLMEDLKANFPKNVNTTFTVWGNIDGCRVDNFNYYNQQDTLIMLLNPARDRKFKFTDNGKVYHEKVGDYTTMGCACSVLKLSNGYVIGQILGKIFVYEDEEVKVPYVDTMLYEDFQKRLIIGG